MDRHNRKSYLAPPAPRAINRDGSRDSISESKSPQQQQQQQSEHYSNPTPTSGEIPLNYSHEPYTQHYKQVPRSIETSTMGFENLHINTSHNQSPINGQGGWSRRSPHPSSGQHSAGNTPQPFSSPRVAPSPHHAPSRNHPQSAGLPLKTGPPSSGSMPPPPVSGGLNAWSRSQGHRV